MQMLKGGVTMRIGVKVCKEMFKCGKWSTKICESFWSRDKRLRCSFLNLRIMEEANKGDKNERQ